MTDRTDGFCAGYAQQEITPSIGDCLAGRPYLRPRLTRRVRDRLFARAIHMQGAGCDATLLAADLVLVTSRLQQAVAREAGVSPSALLACATHTHSGPGGYWRGSLVSKFMGAYSDATFSLLVRKMAEAVVDARRNAMPRTLRGCAAALAGASKSRRRADGPVDSVLSVLRLDAPDQKPIRIVCYGAHGIAGVDLEPSCATADFPGEVCGLLGADGCHAMFLQGAVGGTNPGWLEPGLSLDQHVRLMGRAVHDAVLDAERELVQRDASRLRLSTLPWETSAASCRIFPQGALPGFESLSLPLRKTIQAMAKQGLGDNPALAISYLRMGDVAIVGVPCELGPGVTAAVREELRADGVELPIVVSLCGGYAGYAHMRGEYELVPASGYRALTYYENAMSVGGWGVGERILAAIQAARGR